MPLPLIFPLVGALANVLRIPAIAGMLGGLFFGLMEWLTKFVSRKVAYQLAIITAIMAVTGGFILLIKGLFVGIMVYAPSQIACSIHLFVPSNATACVSAVLSARLVRWVYEWKITFINDYKNMLN